MGSLFINKNRYENNVEWEKIVKKAYTMKQIMWFFKKHKLELHTFAHVVKVSIMDCKAHAKIKIGDCLQEEREKRCSEKRQSRNSALFVMFHLFYFLNLVEIKWHFNTFNGFYYTCLKLFWNLNPPPQKKKELACIEIPNPGGRPKIL